MKFTQLLLIIALVFCASAQSHAQVPDSCDSGSVKKSKKPKRLPPLYAYPVPLLGTYTVDECTGRWKWSGPLGLSAKGAWEYSPLALGNAIPPYTGGAQIYFAAYCGQNKESCSECSAIQTNLQNQMNFHRAGGTLTNGCGGTETKTSFLFDRYWNGTVNPGLQKLLSKIAQATVSQTANLGTFFEAQNNVRSMTALQKGAASAARDYAVSESLCRFGSLGQSLAADDNTSREAQLQLATIGLKRNIGASGNISQAGRVSDINMRLGEFIKEYCDLSDNNNGLDLMCGSNSERRFPDVAKDTRFNRDINYTATIDSKHTVDYETVTRDLTPGEQDVVALGHNLYGSDQMSGRLSDDDLATLSGKTITIPIRSVIASRGVAQNTYAAIAGMKIRGTGGSQAYMKNLFAQLGIPADSVSSVLSDKPSYDAQMDVLTKKLYQDPSFYINLMEGKTNVERQSGAMEGIELMQDRDIYQSMKRSEMLLAVLIQLQSHKVLADKVEDIK